jgi:hypothetical protein
VSSPVPPLLSGVVIAAATLFLIPDIVPSASAATVVHRNRAGGATAIHTRPAPRRAVVVAPVRPVPAVRPWYWGRVVAGVAIGTIIVASAVAVAPKPPSPELCWSWSDSTKTKGYWNYCVPPTQ